jgi:hypothetical protein
VLLQEAITSVAVVSPRSSPPRWQVLPRAPEGRSRKRSPRSRSTLLWTGRTSSTLTSIKQTGTIKICVKLDAIMILQHL